MSDSGQWQSPSGPDPVGPTQFGAPPPPPPGSIPLPPPPIGGVSGPTAPPIGWTPPPKPGLIPLQPMTLGTILGAAFRVLRRNPRPIFGLSLLIEGITVVVTAAIVAFVFFDSFSRITNATSASAVTKITDGSIGLIFLAEGVAIILAVLGTAISQGVFSIEVARGTLGEKLTLAGLWRRAKGRIGALIGWFWALVGIAVAAYVVIVVLIVLIVVLGGSVGVVIGVILGILIFLGAIVLVAWLATKLSLVPAALMIERLPLRRAIARSWSLSNGYFWRTFGIQLLVLFIINTATSVVTAPLEFIYIAVASLFNQTGDLSTAITITVIVVVVSVVLFVVLGAIASIVQSATAALIYIDLRIRKEALDLDLIRFVEARQTGDDTVPDPYLQHPAARPTGDPAAPVPPQPVA